MKKKLLTNADFAFAISHLLRTATTASVAMAEGMWNPDFCSAPADFYAASVIEDLEFQIRNIKKRLPKKL